MRQSRGRYQSRSEQIGSSLSYDSNFNPKKVQIMVSSNADHSNAVPLSGSLSGTKYVFVPNYPGITSVSFYLDGTLVRTEAAAPWDYQGTTAGNGNPWDTSAVADGSHTIRADVTADGRVYQTQSSFVTISNTDTGLPVATTNYDNGAALDSQWAGYQLSAGNSVTNVAAPSAVNAGGNVGVGRVLRVINLDGGDLWGHERAQWRAGWPWGGWTYDEQTQVGTDAVFSFSIMVPSGSQLSTNNGWGWIEDLHSGGSANATATWNCWGINLGSSRNLSFQCWGGPVYPNGQLRPAGTSGNNRSWGPISFDTWYNILIRLRLGADNNGIAEGWVAANGQTTPAKPLDLVNIPLHTYDNLTDWKQGYTRDPAANGTTTIYHDNSMLWAVRNPNYGTTSVAQGIANAFAHYGWI